MNLCFYQLKQAYLNLKQEFGFVIFSKRSE